VDIDSSLHGSYKLAYEQSVRAIESQSEVLESYRGRASTLVSAAAIATSFLGSQAFRSGYNRSDWTWAAVVCFIGVLVACGFVMWPRAWLFHMTGEDVIDIYLEDEETRPFPPAELHRDLAIHLSRNLVGNRRKMRWLGWAIQSAAVLLAFEIVAWIVTLRYHV
jgi:hypothetical protein